MVYAGLPKYIIHIFMHTLLDDYNIKQNYVCDSKHNDFCSIMVLYTYVW